MTILPAALVADVALAAPAALGEIAFSVAVDRTLLRTKGVVDAVRPAMVRQDPPRMLSAELAHETDELSPEPPVVDSFRSPDGSFSITFSRFPGEAETDCWVIVDADIVLHTRNVGSRSFDLCPMNAR